MSAPTHDTTNDDNNTDPIDEIASQMWYIKTIGNGDKRPIETWGGYSQDYDEADTVYTYEESRHSTHSSWAVVGMQNKQGSWVTLIIDIDLYESADPEAEGKRLNVPADALVTKSQSGGFHVYFALSGYWRGELSESDFQVAHDLDWSVDIRGSAVSHHVIAPTEFDGMDTKYTIKQQRTPKTVLEPEDAAALITYDGEPLLEYDPDGNNTSDFSWDRPEEPPEDRPECYHNGLKLREKAPDDHPNTHRVNLLTVLAGLGAGYSVDEVVEHFVEHAPGDGDDLDKEKTRYQVAHAAQKMMNDEYSPPSEESLRGVNILGDDEHCTDCPIDYHGPRRAATYKEVWADYAPDGRSPFVDDDAALVAALRARDAGAVREDAEVPERSLRPLVDYVTAAETVDDAPDVSWTAAREIFDAVDADAVREKGVVDI